MPRRWRRRLTREAALWCETDAMDIARACDWYTVRADGGVLAHVSRGGRVLLVAHLDHLGSGVVHKLTPERIVCSALDDRLGAMLAWHWTDMTGRPADVLFTDCEESGDSTITGLGIGMLDRYDVVIELDRRERGAVCYEFVELEKHLAPYLTIHRGTFSDISALADTSPVSCFNLGVGYRYEHSERCEAFTVDIVAQVEACEAFLRANVGRRFSRRAPFAGDETATVLLERAARWRENRKVVKGPERWSKEWWQGEGLGWEDDLDQAAIDDKRALELELIHGFGDDETDGGGEYGG
jgi:hypothetical protein